MSQIISAWCFWLLLLTNWLNLIKNIYVNGTKFLFLKIIQDIDMRWVVKRIMDSRNLWDWGLLGVVWQMPWHVILRQFLSWKLLIPRFTVSCWKLKYTLGFFASSDVRKSPKISQHILNMRLKTSPSKNVSIMSFKVGNFIDWKQKATNTYTNLTVFTWYLEIILFRENRCLGSWPYPDLLETQILTWELVWQRKWFIYKVM